MGGDGEQQVDAARDSVAMLPSSSDRKKRSDAWNHFRVKESADGKPVKAECIHCGKLLRCETTKGTSVMHNHIKSESCKRKRAAIEQTPDPPRYVLFSLRIHAESYWRTFVSNKLLLLLFVDKRCSVLF